MGEVDEAELGERGWISNRSLAGRYGVSSTTVVKRTRRLIPVAFVRGRGVRPSAVYRLCDVEAAFARYLADAA